MDKQKDIDSYFNRIEGLKEAKYIYSRTAHIPSCDNEINEKIAMYHILIGRLQGELTIIESNDKDKK